MGCALAEVCRGESQDIAGRDEFPAFFAGGGSRSGISVSSFGYVRSGLFDCPRMVESI